MTAGEVEARLRKTGGTAFTVSDCAVTVAVSYTHLDVYKRQLQHILVQLLLVLDL